MKGGDEEASHKKGGDEEDSLDDELDEEGDEDDEEEAKRPAKKAKKVKEAKHPAKKAKEAKRPAKKGKKAKNAEADDTKNSKKSGSASKKYGLEKWTYEASGPGQKNIKVITFDKVQLHPYNMTMYPYMPWQMLVTKDYRCGGTKICRTVDSLVPFPLAPLPAIPASHEIAHGYTERMANCVEEFEKKYWP